MKRLLRLSSLFLGFLILPAWTPAQISVGIQGGPLFSRPTISESAFNDIVSIRTLNGFSVGAVIQLPMKRRLALLIEPALVRKGISFAFDPGYIFNEWTSRLDYVELPFSLKLTFNEAGIQPYLTAGSAVAYKVSERTSFSDPHRAPVDIPDVFARYDVTVLLGGGLSINMLSPVSFMITGRYSFGLNNLEQTGAVGFKSAEWRLGAGVLAPL